MSNNSALSRTDLQVFIYLLKCTRKNPCTRRFSQIVSDLNIPKSTVHRVMHKLVRLKLVSEEFGEYKACGFVSAGPLKNYFYYRGHLFPKYLFLACMYGAIMSFGMFEVAYALKFSLPLTVLLFTVSVVIFFFFILSTWIAGLAQKIDEFHN